MPWACGAAPDRIVMSLQNRQPNFPSDGASTAAFRARQLPAWPVRTVATRLCAAKPTVPQGTTNVVRASNCAY